jgi:hypothetical protein
MINTEKSRPCGDYVLSFRKVQVLALLPDTEETLHAAAHG